jgi:uncharacterized protein (DUF1330 family)
MTLLVVRLRVADGRELQELQQAFSERRSLKTTYGCTGSRLLLDGQDKNSAVVLMDFPSLAAARAYCKTTAFLGTDKLPGMTVLSTEHFEDVPAAAATAGLSNGAAVSPRFAQPS